MNKELSDLIKEFRNEISELPLIKEYNKVSKAFHEDEEINKIQEDLKSLQIKLTKLRFENTKHDYETLKKEITALKDKYYAHPLVNNYFSLKEEVEDLIKEISDILNQIN